VILLCAALSEGIGSPSFEKLIRETASPEDFEARLLDDEFFVVDQWMVQHLCQARRRARVLLYTDGLPFEAAGELLIEAVHSPADGVARGLDHIGNDGRIAVIPQGPYVLATVRGEKRPLGGPAVAGTSTR
jgi:nickel-dependent lactate racemase